VETIDPVAHDFIAYCLQLHGKEWPALYDDMCQVVGHRLFRDMGYEDLRRVGISLSLNHMADTIKMVDIITAEKQNVRSGEEVNYTA
jgi:hypothetical protein